MWARCNNILASHRLGNWLPNMGSTMVSEPTCPVCSGTNQVAKRRMSTLYEDDESNFLTSCIKCYDESEERWQDLRNECYGM